MIRTTEQVLARIEEVKSDDFFGFQREVLYYALPYEAVAATGVLSEGVTEEKWNQDHPGTEEAITADALGYLRFAFGKAYDHRGISASRSVDKMTSYAWVLCRDDVLAEMERADYAQYGVPILVAFAEHFSDESRAVWAEVKNEGLERMATGLPCEPDCYEGCG